MAPIWKRTLFWQKVERTLAIGGLLGQGGMDVLHASDTLKLWILAGNVGALIVAMWMEDRNSDGTVDLFEDNEIKPK